MTAKSSKFNRKQEQAIANLLQYPTIADAAAATGIAEITLFRWLQIPAFNTKYREARFQVVRQAVTGLQQAAGEAVKTLRDVMADEESPASSRVMAARTILDMALKAVELEDMEARITCLEETMQVEG